MKSEDLEAIVDFLYCGEANVFQENLDSFLAIAEELQLKGLTGQDSGNDSAPPKIPPKETEPTFKRESKTSNETGLDPAKEYGQIPMNENAKADRSVALTIPLSGELEDLNNKVKAMLEKTHNVAGNGKKAAYICKVCGKEGEYSNVKRHIESNHLEGVLIPCNLCGKTSRSRHALAMHMRNMHKTHSQ